MIDFLRVDSPATSSVPGLVWRWLKQRCRANGEAQALFILAIRLLVTLVELKLTTLAGFVRIPFEFASKGLRCPVRPAFHSRRYANQACGPNADWRDRRMLRQSTDCCAWKSRSSSSSSRREKKSISPLPFVHARAPNPTTARVGVLCIRPTWGCAVARQWKSLALTLIAPTRYSGT